MSYVISSRDVVLATDKINSSFLGHLHAGGDSMWVCLFLGPLALGNQAVGVSGPGLTKAVCSKMELL